MNRSTEVGSPAIQPLTPSTGAQQHLIVPRGYGDGQAEKGGSIRVGVAVMPKAITSEDHGRTSSGLGRASGSEHEETIE